MTARLAIGLRVSALLVGVILTGAACTTRSSTTSAGPAAPTGALATFAAQFDADVGHRRLVLLMSPT